MSDDRNWECPECEYDKQESGGQPKPDICPMCAGDTGHTVVPQYKDK